MPSHVSIAQGTEQLCCFVFRTAPSQDSLYSEGSVIDQAGVLNHVVDDWTVRTVSFVVIIPTKGSDSCESIALPNHLRCFVEGEIRMYSR